MKRLKHSFVLLISLVNTSKTGTNSTLPIVVEDEKTHCQCTLVVYTSYYCCELCTVHVSFRSIKIRNLEP